MDDTDALLDALDEAHRHLERKLAPPQSDAPSGWAVLVARENDKKASTSSSTVKPSFTTTSATTATSSSITTPSIASSLPPPPPSISTCSFPSSTPTCCSSFPSSTPTCCSSFPSSTPTCCSSFPSSTPTCCSSFPSSTPTCCSSFPSSTPTCCSSFPSSTPTCCSSFPSSTPTCCSSFPSSTPTGGAFPSSTPAASSAPSSSPEGQEVLAEAGRKRQSAAALRQAAAARRRQAAVAPRGEAARLEGEAALEEEQADHLIEAAVQLESFAAGPRAAREACVRATLRRDANGVFGILLKQGEGGVYIARLQQSEAADERALLHEGDVVRRVDGQAIHDLEEAKRLVRQAGGAVTLEAAARGGLPALLDGIGSSLGGLLGELMEKPQVRETRDKVGQQIKRLIETGRDNLEESHHSLQQLGEDVKRKAREVQTNLHGLHAGIAGFAQELLQHPPHGQSSGRRAMPWHCTACTYDNFVSTHACEMCETPRERSDAAAADGAVGAVGALGAAARPLCSDWAAEAYALPPLGAAAAEAPPLCSPLEAMRGGATEETQLARAVELSPRLPQPLGGEPRAAEGAAPPLEGRPQQQA